MAFTLRCSSDPNMEDSDGDSYYDKEDLAPMTPYKTPIVLLHGRGDNSSGCFWYNYKHKF